MEKEHETDKEEIVDFKGFKNFFTSKYFIRGLPVLLILIALFFSVYFRITTAYLPIMDSYARDTVETSLKNQLADQILKESPNLPPETITLEVDRRYALEAQKSKTEIDQAVKSLADSFRAKMQDENGDTYLLELDPYTYYRRAKNYIDHGHIGDILVNGTPYDNHMMAPIGRFDSGSLHPYVEAYFYKMLHPLTGQSLKQVIFILPVILSALAVFPAFFIGRKIAGNLGGFVSAFIVAVHPAFISRTVAGFSDTDPYNVTLPLFITWMFLIAIEEKVMWKRITYTSVGGLLVGIFAYAWSPGWWYIFDFLVAAGAAYILYYSIVYFREHKMNFIKQPEVVNGLIVFAVFIVVSGIFVSLFSSFHSFIYSAQAPIKFLSLKSVATETVWPNVYTTVAEQNAVDFPSVISSMGGKLLFYIALLGLMLSMFKTKLDKNDYILLGASVVWFALTLKFVPNSILFIVILSIPLLTYLGLNLFQGRKDVNVIAFILMFLWFMSTLYASTQGARFNMLLVPVFSIAIGICLGVIAKKFSELISDGLHINRKLVYTTVVLASLMVLIVPATAGWQISVREMPILDDALYNSLTYIKNNSNSNAIITSWWDYGHLFKAVADRPVTFDGASQNTPMAHWVGKILLTGDEDIAVGTLKMLDCGSNKAFEELEKYITYPRKTIDILNEIFLLDKTKALAELQNKGLTKGQAENVLRYTHCDAPEAFFITSGDMVGKSGVWAHFGAWDFNRATMYMDTLQLSKDEGTSYLIKNFNMTEEQATKTYYEIQTQDANNWIAPWPAYSQAIGCRAASNTTIDCSGFVIDFAKKTVQVPSGLPKSLAKVVYMSTQGFTELTVDANGDFALAITADGTNAVIMDTVLGDSMFTRLFYYKGVGLKHFDLVKEDTSINGDKILVWKVDWQGLSENTLPAN